MHWYPIFTHVMLFVCCLIWWSREWIGGRSSRSITGIYMYLHRFWAASMGPRTGTPVRFTGKCWVGL